MNEPFTTHDVMTIERTYSAPVQRVFRAWADAEQKRLWFTGAPDSDYRLDFRVGGREVSRGGAPGSEAVFTYDAEFVDIVDERRIVYTNHMLRGDTRISASLTSVEFRPHGEETTLMLTEHGIFLDGEDQPEDRRQGIAHQLDTLARALQQWPVLGVA
jgi:uncharacterized protein YndB with AHSA1/START domain